MTITYTCPMLGKRTIYVFSEQVFKEETDRLTKLGWEFDYDPELDDYEYQQSRFI